jgi:hypothetical protein
MLKQFETIAKQTRFVFSDILRLFPLDSFFQMVY